MDKFNSRKITNIKCSRDAYYMQATAGIPVTVRMSASLGMPGNSATKSMDVSKSRKACKIKNPAGSNGREDINSRD